MHRFRLVGSWFEIRTLRLAVKVFAASVAAR